MKRTARNKYKQSDGRYSKSSTGNKRVCIKYVSERKRIRKRETSEEVNMALKRFGAEKMWRAGRLTGVGGMFELVLTSFRRSNVRGNGRLKLFLTYVRRDPG